MPAFNLPSFTKRQLQEMQPAQYAYPKDNGGPIKGVPGVDLSDVLRTAVGNTQGPVPKQQLDQLTPSELRALKNKRFEDGAGWARPLAQFVNALTAPSVPEGMLIGIPNALMKGAEWLVDPEGALPGDTPQIPRNALAGVNPYREGDVKNTPADDAGYELGAEAAAEGVGLLTGASLVKQLGRAPQVLRIADRLRKTQAVKRLAVAGKGSKRLRRGINLTRWGAEGVLDTSIAALFQDPEFGNSADLTELFGVDNPLQTDPDDIYPVAQVKKVTADAILLPLALIGGSQLTPWTRRLADGNMPLGLDELAEIELAPYVPRQITQPLLPPGSAVDQQFDSAIDRTTSAQRQAQQVAEQQERVNTMFPGLRELNSDQLAMDITAVGGTGAGNDLSRVDTPEGEVVGGPEFEFKERPKQGALDLGEFGDAPDPRPEISTYLAELDELDDDGLRRVLGNVNQDEQINLRQQSLEEAQSRLAAAADKVADVQARLALPDGAKRKLTEKGSKRLLNKATQEFDLARVAVNNQSGEKFTAANVGDQLAMELNSESQLDLDLDPTPDVELPSLEKFEFDEPTGTWRTKKSDLGYPSLEAYRDDIAGWNRDLLREMAKPTNNPEVAALIKARTGRRSWSAKKQDIVEALVEVAGRTKRYAIDPGRQLDIPNQQGLLPVNNLTRTLDSAIEPSSSSIRPGLSADQADSSPLIEGVAIDVPFQRRGMSATDRELMKKKILQAAIDAGEVQPDVVSPPASLPETQFSQGSLIDELFLPGEGQTDLLAAYAMDEVPTYKAGGRNAEALIEEIRARFDWAEIDGAGQKAQRQAMWEKQGWNKLTWDERKRLMMLSREETGLYRDTPGEVTDVGTTTQLMEWTPEGDVPVSPAAAVKKPQEPKAEPKTKKRQAQTSEQKKVNRNIKKADDKVRRLQKQLEEATCNG